MADSLIALTIETWQPLSPTPLTAEDAAEIISSFSAFVTVLRRWQTLAKAEEDERPTKTSPNAPQFPKSGHQDGPALPSEEIP